MNELKTANVVRIKAGQEHQILDDQTITEQESLMYPAFSTAVDALSGIVRHSDDWKYAEDERGNSDNTKNKDKFYGYSNNILAFCAPRGQGKTSAMLSFSNALQGKGDNPYKKLDVIKEDHSFRCLSPIDPTMLSESESVIQLVLGILFSEISIKWSTADNWRSAATQQESEKIQILEDIKSCYKSLQYINQQSSKENSPDDFEKMLATSDIFQLKKHIHDIIMYYFKLLRWNAEHSFLVIQLDDTDMQMKNAYSILEEVRKYLAMPNVVVLMATYFEQLRILITQQYATQLKSYSDLAKRNELTRRMAAKYLDKLIPASQTVHLPTMRLQRDTEKKLMLVVERNGVDSEPDELENKMFSIIYEKTGLAFIRHNNYMHNLLPTTLRGLQHLFRLLDQMMIPPKPEAIEFGNYPEQKEKKKEYYIRMREHLDGKYRNLLLFESYFLNDWCNSKITDEDWKILEELDNTASIRRLHRAVDILTKKFKREESICVSCPQPILTLLKSEEKELLEVLQNISSGYKEFRRLSSDSDSSNDSSYYIQLMLLLAEGAKQCITEADHLFVFAVETYFSIQFNKLAIVDQIASINDGLEKLNISDASMKESDSTGLDNQLLYKFNGLINHLYDGHDKPQKTSDWKRVLNEWLDDFDKLSGKLHNNNIKLTAILKSFLRLFDLSELKSQTNRPQVNSIMLQEYLVYFCCNLDVLAQVLKRSDAFISKGKTDLPSEVPSRDENPPKPSSTAQSFFWGIKDGIVIKKLTRAYPFQHDSKTLADAIIELLGDRELYASAAETESRNI